MLGCCHKFEDVRGRSARPAHGLRTPLTRLRQLSKHIGLTQFTNERHSTPRIRIDSAHSNHGVRLAVRHQSMNNVPAPSKAPSSGNMQQRSFGTEVCDQTLNNCQHHRDTSSSNDIEQRHQETPSGCTIEQRHQATPSSRGVKQS